MQLRGIPKCEGTDMTLIHLFPGSERASLAEVGGKGYSLIRMADAGFPIPSGAVLTTQFFAPWFDEIQASAPWKTLTEATPDKWSTLCSALKGLAPTLRLTTPQQQALEVLRKNLAAQDEGSLFAVRSSSPDEDLDSASFAGGYESRLGVRISILDNALRYCFASSLDERVLVYKKAHGFDYLSPSIAVVVQQQVDSDIAGVGFSLNPRTNDYDEAVFEANWGLGTSVVGGLASPDHFTVDKIDRQIVQKKRGAKQVSIRLNPDGGVVERQDLHTGEITLDDAQLGELTDVLCRIEALYEKPMDIEWAFADSRLYVLQARPITAYVPLPPEMLTTAGEPRRLYIDAALSKGMTINAPISSMGLDWMEDIMSSLFEKIQLNIAPGEGLVFSGGNRIYMNLSNLMWLVNPKRLSKSSTANDALLAEILANIDTKRYRAPSRPLWMGYRMLRFIPKILWWLRGFCWNTLWAVLSPQGAYRAYQQQVNAYEEALNKDVDDRLSLKEYRHMHTVHMARLMMGVTMAALMASLIALGSIDRIVGRRSPRAKALAQKLKRGFKGNLVVEMGIALFRLAKLLEPSDFEETARLAERVKNREMSTEFLSAWDVFLSRFGCRGPLEMDLASPRYADDPGLALRQMSFMSVDDDAFDPQAAHLRQVAERQQAYQELMSRSGWLRRALLRRIYRIIDLFAGTRDTPKYHIVLLNYALRKRALIEGRRLVHEGRLDAAEDVFDLMFRDLESAALDPSLNLRKLREERTRFSKMLKAKVSVFPSVIDSRGRIIRPPFRREKPGQLSGMAVSPGVATGPVKILRNPYQKAIDKGDVLVAYTTDPGWTPLFVNAAAVVLEVGGTLQHGAVIAREYGKPCVVGIDGLMTKLYDGQMVEVDGTAGVIRLLSQPSAAADRNRPV